jgi:hypothetical protein
MATDKNLIKDIDMCYQEAYSAQALMHQEFEEDDGFYLGGLKQWNANDIAKMSDENRTIISKNKVAKPVNLVTGHFRQNKIDLKYHPVESNDQETADIYTELSKWAIDYTGGRENTAFQFGDCVRVGLGWCEVKMEYYRDPLYGDIAINLLNKYNIMFDPYATDPTQKDWNYIIRYGYPSKENAINAYPEMEDEIRKLKSSSRQKFLIQEYSNINDAGFRVNIVEKWYRVYEKKLIIIDPMTLEFYEWKGGKRKFNQLMEAQPELKQRIALIEARLPRIKLVAQADEKVLLYDDYAPDAFSKTMYPFIPMFCYYLPNFNDWQYKVKGIVRDLKDPQRELNKLNAIYMETAMSMPQSGWVYETNAVKDPEELDKSGGAQKIEVRNGKGLGNGLWPIQPPQMNQVLSQLYENYGRDFADIGPNADILGMIGSDSMASSSDASGASLQHRTKQGMMSLQNPFDGAALAYRMIGKCFLELMNKWPKTKIERILGRPISPQFEKSRRQNKFDVIPDTQTGSATYRLATYAQLQSYVQHGIQIPQSILREASDIPAKLKAKWAQAEQAQMQQAMQQRKEEQQLRMAEINMSQQGLIQAQKVETQGKLMIEQMDQKGDEKIEEMKGMNRLAVEKLKQQSA